MGTATVITLLGLLVAFIAFERTLVLSFHVLTRPVSLNGREEWSPGIGRRAFVLSALGILIAGGGAAVVRKLFRAATFSYDGTQYKGEIVKPITPNEQFYCVTKNVVDPVVEAARWRLEITGLVRTPRVYRFEELMSLPAVDQETTLMCISNLLDGGLMSNAVWKGIPMRVCSNRPVRSKAQPKFASTASITTPIRSQSRKRWSQRRSSPIR